MRSALLGLALCGCASASEIDDRPACDPSVVRRFEAIRVTGTGFLTGDYEVDQFGYIDVPSFGRIKVGNLTPPAIAEILTKQSNEASPHYAIVEPTPAAIKIEKLPAANTIRIVGGVAPATFEYKRGMTAQGVLRDAGHEFHRPAFVYQRPCMNPSIVENKPLSLVAGDVVFVGVPSENE
jgi:hypothetical protein